MAKRVNRDKLVKIMALSDMHGTLPEITEDFDLMLICGDVCPAHDHTKEFQEAWINTTFLRWISGLPFRNDSSRVIMTFGNHDFFERIGKKKIDELYKKSKYRLQILKNSSIDFIAKGMSISVFGTPYCKIFYNWAHMLPPEELVEKYKKIPKKVDILISHDAPDFPFAEYGVIHDGWQKGKRVGNVQLYEAIVEKKPRVALHGHIHSSDHSFLNMNGTYVACVSYVDERYKPAYEPLVFWMDEKKKVYRKEDFNE